MARGWDGADRRSSFGSPSPSVHLSPVPDGTPTLLATAGTQRAPMELSRLTRGLFLFVVPWMRRSRHGRPLCYCIEFNIEKIVRGGAMFASAPLREEEPAGTA